MRLVFEVADDAETAEFLRRFRGLLNTHDNEEGAMINARLTGRLRCLPGCDRADGHDGRDPGACMKGGQVLTRGCPDGGACHHGCTGACWRTRWASPLSMAGWGDTWPAKVLEVERAKGPSGGHL
jgi:hypothetical protein